MELTVEQQQRQADMLAIAEAVVDNMRFNRNGMMSMGDRVSQGWSVQDLFQLEEPSLNSIFVELKKTKTNLESQVELYEDHTINKKIGRVEAQMRIVRIASTINKARRNANNAAAQLAKEKAKSIHELEIAIEKKKLEKLNNSDLAELEASLRKLKG